MAHGARPAQPQVVVGLEGVVSSQPWERGRPRPPQQRRAGFPTRRLQPRRVRARGDQRSPGTASSPCQMNRAPWAAHEDSSPRTRSAGMRRPSFLCISCISWFHKPRGADRLHAGTMPPACCRRCVQGSHARCFNAAQGWNHETHETHENPSPPAQCNGCGMARFVGGVPMRPMPWDRARPRAHPLCPSPPPRRPGTAALPGLSDPRRFRNHPRLRDAPSLTAPPSATARAARSPSGSRWRGRTHARVRRSIPCTTASRRGCRQG